LKWPAGWQQQHLADEQLEQLPCRLLREFKDDIKKAKKKNKGGLECCLFYF